MRNVTIILLIAILETKKFFNRDRNQTLKIVTYLAVPFVLKISRLLQFNRTQNPINLPWKMPQWIIHFDIQIANLHFYRNWNNWYENSITKWFTVHFTFCDHKFTLLIAPFCKFKRQQNVHRWFFNWKIVSLVTKL